jgi:hypothetical protein
MSVVTNKAVCRRHYEDVLTNKQLGVVDEIYANQIAYGDGQSMPREQFKMIAMASTAAFPDQQYMLNLLKGTMSSHAGVPLARTWVTSWGMDRPERVCKSRPSTYMKLLTVGFVIFGNRSTRSAFPSNWESCLRSADGQLCSEMVSNLSLDPNRGSIRSIWLFSPKEWKESFQMEMARLSLGSPRGTGAAHIYIGSS